MTVIFGKPWDAPIVDNAEYTALTPVGDRCLLCWHRVVEDDQGFLRAYGGGDEGGTWSPIHRGCDMASTAGHIFGVCTCTGWHDLYAAGLELVRRADAGELRTAGP